MIIDDIYLEVHAGKGGDGSVSFRREKFIPRGGPDGGNGGNGGNVYIRTVSNLSALSHFRHNKVVKAEDGENGRAKKMNGARGKDIYIDVPVGTTLTDTESGDTWECAHAGEEFQILRGGYGGKGNYELRSNENKTPREAEKGRAGQSKNIHVSLAYIADVGLIGLPSAGKSSLLNELTAAEAKVGEYPFTTLEPNLGVCGKCIIADIPGLIEGAHAGKGLGIKFLKHIQKTRLLLHCIDSSSTSIIEDYKTIRNELEKYSDELLKKTEVIVLTKTDLMDQKSINASLKKLKKFSSQVEHVSLLDDESIERLKNLLIKVC